MSELTGLFGNVKLCQKCNRPLPQSYSEDLCPACKDRQLFWEVKEYIRANIVNEHDVAEHFNIPLKQVKGWIREGRIEYRTENPQENLSAIHCKQCGAPITFGTLCSNCMRTPNASKGYAALPNNKNSDSRMRFIDNSGESHS